MWGCVYYFEWFSMLTQTLFISIVRWNGIQRPILKTFYANWMEFTLNKNADWKQSEWVWVCGDNFYFVHSSVRLFVRQHCFVNYLLCWRLCPNASVTYISDGVLFFHCPDALLLLWFVCHVNRVLFCPISHSLCVFTLFTMSDGQKQSTKYSIQFHFQFVTAHSSECVSVKKSEKNLISFIALYEIKNQNTIRNGVYSIPVATTKL